MGRRGVLPVAATGPAGRLAAGTCSVQRSANDPGPATDAANAWLCSHWRVGACPGAHWRGAASVPVAGGCGSCPGSPGERGAWPGHSRTVRRPWLVRARATEPRRCRAPRAPVGRRSSRSTRRSAQVLWRAAARLATSLPLAAACPGRRAAGPRGAWRPIDRPEPRTGALLVLVGGPRASCRRPGAPGVPATSDGRPPPGPAGARRATGRRRTARTSRSARRHRVQPGHRHEALLDEEGRNRRRCRSSRRRRWARSFDDQRRMQVTVDSGGSAVTPRRPASVGAHRAALGGDRADGAWSCPR